MFLSHYYPETPPCSHICLRQFLRSIFNFITRGEKTAMFHCRNIDINCCRLPAPVSSSRRVIVICYQPSNGAWGLQSREEKQTSRWLLKFGLFLIYEAITQDFLSSFTHGNYFSPAKNTNHAETATRGVWGESITIMGS